MNYQRWLFEWDGPRSIRREGSEFVCMLGWNEGSLNGGAYGREVEGRGGTEEEAIKSAFEAFHELRYE